MNRDNLIRAGLALLCVLGGWWFVNATEWTDVEVQTPAKGEAATNPFYIAQAILRRLGATVVRQQSLDVMPPPGATLFLQSQQWSLLPGRGERLREWVARGGQLVISGQMLHQKALDDWLPVRESASVVRAPAGAASAASAPARIGRGTAGRAVDVERDCRELNEPQTLAPAFPQEPVQRGWRICHFASYALTSPQLPAWRIDGPDGAEVLRVASGRGSVTVLAPRGIFNGERVLLGDNALLLAAAAQVRAGQEVWFVTEEARDGLLAWLWHNAWLAIALLLAALALALWRNGARFGPLTALPEAGRRSMTEQVLGTAGFLAHHGQNALHLAQLRALEEAAARHLQRYATLVPADRARAIAQATALDPVQLVRAFNVALRRPRNDLHATLALLETARRRLLEPRTGGPAEQSGSRITSPGTP